MKTTRPASESPKTERPSDAPLPSERDEGANATGGVPSEHIQQAHRDVNRGLRDTSRGEASDAAYQKQKK